MLEVFTPSAQWSRVHFALVETSLLKHVVSKGDCLENLIMSGHICSVSMPVGHHISEVITDDLETELMPDQYKKKF